MKIGLILNAAPGYSETFFRNKMKSLTENGDDLVLFVDQSNGVKVNCKMIEGFSWNGTWRLKIIKMLVAISRLFGSPLKAYRLYKANLADQYSTEKNVLSLLRSAHILNFNLDWIHFGFSTAALGRENLARFIGARMAVSIRGTDISVYPLKHPGCYNLLWKRTDKLHYISDDLLKLAVKNGFDSNTAHSKITPAINTNFFSGGENISFSFPVKIVTVARLHWMKGLEYTLEAMHLLNSRGIDFQYTIVGDGQDYERLVFAAYQLGIKDKVLFVGRKTPSEVKSILSNSDVYVQYSIQEGFCNAVLEAQAAGVLCIVSNAGGLTKNIIHNQTGFVVRKRSPQELADQITKVLTLSERERKKISENAKKRINEKFNLDVQKFEFVEFYK